MNDNKYVMAKKFIHSTHSLCNTCYKHIPGEVYEENGQILLSKTCSDHGTMTAIVELDPDFYYSLEYIHKVHPEIDLEVTDKCNLKCPHCYHLPNNKLQDIPIEDIINQIKSWPEQYIVLAGAEATLRKDYIKLIQRINEEFPNKSSFHTLSNGIKFSDPIFTNAVSDAGMRDILVGLNHYSYQGSLVHQKQLKGIRNIQNTNMTIGYIGYTIETLDHLPDILAEIDEIDHPKHNMYRIRCGSFIGRSSDSHRSYLSSTFKRVKELIGSEITILPRDNNPYHINIEWRGKEIRLIQWPDVTNIDMEELSSGPYAQFYNGPITNFVHQVITRDAFKNKGLPMLDECPVQYRFNPWGYHYWKDSITGKKDIIEY